MLRGYEVVRQLAKALGLPEGLAVKRITVECPIPGPVSVYVHCYPDERFQDAVTETLRVLKVESISGAGGLEADEPAVREARGD